MMKEWPVPKVGEIWRDRDKRMWSGNRRVRIHLVFDGAVTYQQVIGANNENTSRLFRSQLARFSRAFEQVER